MPKQGPIAPPLRDRVEHPWAMYQYHQGDVFLPGAGNYVFEPAYSLVPYSVQGRSTMAGNSPAALQSPQVWYRQATPVVGIGGVQAGQLAYQGLLAPDNEGE